METTNTMISYYSIYVNLKSIDWYKSSTFISYKEIEKEKKIPTRNKFKEHIKYDSFVTSIRMLINIIHTYSHQEIHFCVSNGHYYQIINIYTLEIFMYHICCIYAF